MLFSRRLVILAALLGSLLLPRGVCAQGTPNFVTPEEQAAGWRLLFDGKTVTGFRGVEKPDFLHSGWTIEDGALVLSKTIDQQGKITGGDLVTVAQFSDFEFAFEWKLTVSAASGVIYGARAGFGMKPTGYIFQIIDDVHNPDGLKGGPLKHTGALYGILPTGKNEKIVETGWNSGRILVQGTHAEHWVNGEKVLEYNFASPALLQAVRASSQRLGLGFGMKPVGPIVLMDKGEGISFRSLKVRVPLPPSAATPVPAPGLAPRAVTPQPVGPTPFKSRIPIPGEPN